MQLTIAQLKINLPTNRRVDLWIEAVNTILPEYKINNIERIAAFIAQTAHESSDWTRLEENLNYNATRLLEVWPNRFSRVTADMSAHKPELIANLAYCNRMGNRGPESGDGYRYRGRGIIQLTGCLNYTERAKSLGIPVEQLVSELSTPAMALRVAADYWESNNLNTLADRRQITRITRVINGGDLGLTDRKERYNRAIKSLKG